MSLNRDTLPNQEVQGPKSRLNGAAHWTDYNEINVEVRGELCLEALLEVPALIPAELGELRVGN